MKESKDPEKTKGGDRASPELGVVSINCYPAPDAEDRLRRLMSILLRHAARDREAESNGSPQSGALPDNAGVDA